MRFDNRGLVCADLPSKPNPGVGKILVSGATGYIGGRLVPELLARGYRVRVMVRVSSPEHKERWPGAEVVVADALDPDSLIAAMTGIHTVYYLIHSMLLGPKKFESADVRTAVNFRKAAELTHAKRIIYLGGLGDLQPTLSAHLRSRIEVARELGAGKVPVTILRAAVIIGSGSASYEIIKHLVNNLLLIFSPYWAKTRCQPICIRDVIKYLVGVLETPETAGKSYDIGGRDVLTYEMMLKTLMLLLGKKRVFVPVPALPVGLYAYVVSLVTPVPAQITRLLMEGAKNEVVCRNREIERVLPFKTASYKESLLRAMSREEQDLVHSRWSDAYPPAHVLAVKLRELKRPPHYISFYSLMTDKSASSLFRSICKIGGDEGWFHDNWMWRLRGMLDSLLMGVGTLRGRRSRKSLRVNDVIDFWRVEDLRKESLLLLRAEMKLPGKAWLEFGIVPEGGKNRLYVKAYFAPYGLPGKLYWYNFLPFHHFIFNDLIEQIEKRS